MASLSPEGHIFYWLVRWVLYFFPQKEDNFIPDPTHTPKKGLKYDSDTVQYHKLLKSLCHCDISLGKVVTGAVSPAKSSIININAQSCLE